jgi:hypothetical protein
MPQKPFYKIIAAPIAKRNIIGKIITNPKKRQILVSVLAIYTIVGSLVALTLFTRSDQNSSAYQPALITSAIRVESDKDYGKDDTIEMKLTVQNTSSTQSIRDINLDLQSTKNSVKWNKVEYRSGETVLKSFPIENNKSTLDLLTSGERIEYALEGKIEATDLNYATVIGRLQFTNQEGTQTFSTNRILINSKDTISTEPEVLTLSSDQNVYTLDNTINLTVAPKGTFDETKYAKLEGKVFVSNKLTHEVVSDGTCTINETLSCSTNIGTLPVGKYTSMFMTKDEKVFSTLHAFEVLGNDPLFKPNPSATLQLPFDSTSINGMIAVYANRVLDNNKVAQIGDSCNFVVSREGKKVSETKAQVNSDSTCYTTISASSLPGDGLYTVSLEGSDQKKDVVVTNRSLSPLKLEQKSLALLKNKPIDFYSTGIFANGTNAQSPTPITSNEKVTLGIYHPSTGSLEQVNSSNGDSLKANQGNFSASISGEYFNKGGNYMVYIRTADGQFSDFVNFSIDDKEVGFAQTGVVIDSSSNLTVGANKEFTVGGIVDRNNTIVSRGSCAADIYTTGNSITPLVARGEIRDGVCTVQSAPEQIKNSGPILVSFNSEASSNRINQSRQFTINSGIASKFGGINLEFEPARSGFANTAYIGPITDLYGNLTDSAKKKLLIKQGDAVIKEINVEIENGFARVVLPSSTMISGEMTLSLQNIEDGAILLSRPIAVTDSIEKNILPAFPSLQNSEENLVASISNLKDIENGTECKLQYIRATDELFEAKTQYNIEKNSCEFNSELNTLRNNRFGLLKLTVGDKLAFHGIVENEAAEAENIFVMTPQVEPTQKDEVNISLLSSPIVDKQGFAVQKGKVKTQINGRIEELEILNGLVKLTVLADKLDNKDIIKKFEHKFLELNINAKASVTSLSKTNTISLFLGSKDVSNKGDLIKASRISNQVKADQPTLFEFESEYCNALILSKNNQVKVAQSHHQGTTCYVQINEEPGNYTLSFEESGFVKYSVDFKSVRDSATIDWCDEKMCTIQIIGETNGKEKVILYDEDKQYTFENSQSNSGIVVEQNGLNPLKDYLVEVVYTDSNGNQVSQMNTISGELLNK